MNRSVVFMIALSVLAVDRLAKTAALICLEARGPIKILPGIFHLTLVLNRGAAFGLFKGEVSYLIAVAILVIAAILAYLSRQRGVDRWSLASLGLILGGAVGNLWDRMVFGSVVDFLDFRVWPVFNVADSCITVGTLILLYRFLCIR